MRDDLGAIYKKVCKLAGVPGNNPPKKKFQAILAALKKIELELMKNKEANIEINKRVNNILRVVKAYAKLDFNKKASIKTSANHFDALASGINMLGEELQSSTVSLQEKEVLLKEIHHRVKNNLQIISSLLSLQTEKISDKNLLNFFSENRRRIKSMALVHETLYQSRNISKVDFATYLCALVDSIKEAYKDTRSIKVVLETESHNLKIDTAIPCGLIVNELITNSFKYAFEGREKGEIHLRFAKQNNKSEKYILRIHDDGIGLPKHFNLNTSSSLGLQLVSMLTDQLDGEVSFENKKGASFTIAFPG